MKIVTWNVNSLNVRLPHLLQWLEENQPDVVCLQETKLTDDKFPQVEIEAAGYHVVFAGQKTYNGVAVLSRYAIEDVVTDIPDLDDPQRRILAVTIKGVRIVDLYVPNGKEVGDEKYLYKLDWLSKVKQYVGAQLQKSPQVVVLGDFNIAPTDDDVHDVDSWHEKILCSSPERQALQSLLDLGMHDAFRLFEQAEASFSWWDYRAAGFRRNLGLRIDLILVSDALKDKVSACQIDKTPRAWERPSDHAPVWAKLEL
ncbi:MAG: exodeoxyribonuclease III [Gammaproteobacteria bacterium]|nr:MAG: exodeoxyribonuclease III [Gammaproteobacteria bacterium]